MPPNVRLFAGFTSSSAFRYSAIFIVRLKNFQTTPPNSLCLPSCNGPFRIVDVERPCPSTTHFEEIGLTRRCSEPLPAWPFMAKVIRGGQSGPTGTASALRMLVEPIKRERAGCPFERMSFDKNSNELLPSD